MQHSHNLLIISKLSLGMILAYFQEIKLYHGRCSKLKLFLS